MKHGRLKKKHLRFNLIAKNAEKFKQKSEEKK